MKRTLYFIAGLVLVVSSFPTLFVVTDLSLLGQVGTVLTGIGGLLFVIAARRDEVRVGGRRLEWFHFAGGGDACIGVGLPVSMIARSMGGGSSTMDLVTLGAVSLAGLVLVGIGLDMLRGGKYVQIRD
jgi:hypothetical protein